MIFFGVKCEDCKHLISKRDAQRVISEREVNEWHYDISGTDGWYEEKTYRTYEYYCPQHHKKYDIEYRHGNKYRGSDSIDWGEPKYLRIIPEHREEIDA